MGFLIGLVPLFFIAKNYAKLAVRFKRNVPTLVIFGVAVGILVQVVFGLISYFMASLFRSSFFEDIHFLLAVMGVGFSMLICTWVASLFERHFENNPRSHYASQYILDDQH